MKLIVPMAGLSTRFPGIRPKWMLTHPKGLFMANVAIQGLNLNDFEKIYFVFLQCHEDQYHFIKGFNEELEELSLIKKVKLVQLDAPTADQPETVYQAIIKNNIKGPILIKDSDNYFSTNAQPENYVCYYDLNKAGLIKPQNKSYIVIDEFNNIINIIEKNVISPFFSVGGYGFKDANIFIKTFDRLKIKTGRYLSNIIFECILQKEIFSAIPVQSYCDWGTLEDWERYKKSFGTLFIDLDGVLIEHSSSHFPPYYGESGIIQENVEIVKKLWNTGKFQIIFTTSRPEKYRSLTKLQLEKYNIQYDQLLMGLYHAKRIIINDYSKSNPYKSCDAINLKRNSKELKDILRDSLGIDYDEI